MIKKGQLVHISWQDAEAHSGWTSEEEIDDQDLGSMMCETVGYLAKLPSKTSPIYVVASTRSQGEKLEYNAIMKIPKAWVKEIKELD